MESFNRNRDYRSRIPRNQHYRFVQSFLFQLIQDDAQKSLIVLSSDIYRPKIEQILTETWNSLYNVGNINYPGEEPIVIDKLLFSSITIDEFKTIVLFTLPTPIATTESYFAGVYYCHSKDKETVSECRFFTLEYSEADLASFCELEENRHSLIEFHSHQDSEISSEVFIEKIRNKVNC